MEIELTKGYHAIVDDEDYACLMLFNWSASVAKNKDGSLRVYAARYERTSDGKKRHVLMHRQIMGEPATDVDHRDRDGLNNKRLNLRIASRSQNNANAKKRSFTASPFKGVYRYRGGWGAVITLNGKTKYFGRFDTQIEAALTYNEAAKSLFGEFARLNVIPEQRQETGP